MGDARKRGTRDERKAKAITEGRVKVETIPAARVREMIREKVEAAIFRRLFGASKNPFVNEACDEEGGAE